MNIFVREAYNELDKVKTLFNEYVAMLNVDLCFQNYEEELAKLPDKYSKPLGRLYLIDYNNHLAGCVALRPIDEKNCEMKRLYVRPKFRGYGLGRLLAEKVIQDAKIITYKKMYLDTLETLQSAVKMYKNLGFKPIPPYYHNPLPNVLYFCLEL